MSVLEHVGAWTFEELADLPDDGQRYEVVDGNLLVTPPPSHVHQGVSAAIFSLLKGGCTPQWRVYYEFALPLGTDGRIPDLVVVRADAPISRSTPYPVGPEFFGLVVEVVSSRTRKTDRFTKPGEYAEAGIPLFWRVELEPEIEVFGFELRDGAYVPTAELLTPWGPITVDPGALLD